MSGRLWADERYRGTHGIGRYASEVLSRIDDWTPLSLPGKPGSPLDAARRLPGNRQDVVYSPGYAGFVSRTRQILTIHDLIHLQTRWPARAKYIAYYNAVVRPIVRRAGVVVTVSETSRAAIQDWLRDDRVQVVNAGIGVSSAFVDDGVRHEEVHPYLMYVGNLRAHKNLDVVLAALKGIDEVRLYAVVPAAERDLLRQRATFHGVADRVVPLAGLEDDELAAYYRGAAATVMPSTLEGFGLPALESVMSGTPVVHWQGCRAVAETVGSFGTAVASASDKLQWREAIQQITERAPSVIPLSRSDYQWDRTAALVRRTIETSL